MINQEKLHELFSYNPKSGILRWKVKPTWHVEIGDIAGTSDSGGYIQISIRNKLYKAHRLVWLYHNGQFPHGGLDHINRNPADNRIENLREASQSYNMRNTGNRTNNKSGVKGICSVPRVKTKQKWHAQITVNCKNKHLGYYKNLDDAVKARYEEEQRLGWSDWDKASPACKYLIEKGMI